MLKRPNKNSLSLFGRKVLVDYRDQLIIKEVARGHLRKVEIAFVFNISPQLINNIIKKNK